MSESPNSRMFEFAAMLNWAKNWTACRHALVFLLLFFLFGVGSEKVAAQPSIDFTGGTVINQVVFQQPGSEGFTGEYSQYEINAITRIVNYLNDIVDVSMPTHFGGNPRAVFFQKRPAETTPTATGGWGGPTGLIVTYNIEWALNSEIQGQQFGGNAFWETVLLHELGHALGILFGGPGITLVDGSTRQSGSITLTGLPSAWSTSDGGYWLLPNGQVMTSDHVGQTFDYDLDNLIMWVGTHASAVNGDVWAGGTARGVAIHPEIGGVGHPYDPPGSVMSYRTYSRNFFSEIELAYLQDMGYTIQRDRFFGRSLNRVHEGIIYNDQAFRGDGTYGIGLHILWSDDQSAGGTLHADGNAFNPRAAGNTVVQQAHLVSTGLKGAGIRIEGFNHTVTIDSGVIVAATGEYGFGVIANMAGANTVLNNYGTIYAARLEITQNQDGTYTTSPVLDENGRHLLNYAVYADGGGGFRIDNSTLGDNGVNFLAGSTVVGHLHLRGRQLSSDTGDGMTTTNALMAIFRSGAALSPYSKLEGIFTGTDYENVFATLMVHGDLQMDNGSLLRVGLGNQNGLSDLVMVEGTADLGSIIVDIWHMNLGNHTYTILEAATLNFTPNSASILYENSNIGSGRVSVIENIFAFNNALQITLDVSVGSAETNIRHTWLGSWFDTNGDAHFSSSWFPATTAEQQEMAIWTGLFFVDGDGVIFNNQRLYPSSGIIDIIAAGVTVADMTVQGDYNWTFNGGSITGDAQFLNDTFTPDPGEDPRVANATGKFVMAGNNVVTLNVNTTFLGNHTAGISFHDPLHNFDGSGRVASGLLVLNANHVFHGMLIDEEGTLLVGSSFDAGGGLQVGTGTLTSYGDIVNHGLIAFNTSNAINFYDDMRGAGSVYQIGTGITTLAGNNTYTGETLVTSGELRVGSLTGTSLLAVQAGAAFRGVSRADSEVIVNGDLFNDGTISTINYLRAGSVLNAGTIENIGTLEVFQQVATGGLFDVIRLSDDVLQLVYNPGNGAYVGFGVNSSASPDSALYGDWYEIFAYNFIGGSIDYSYFVYREPGDPYEFMDGYDNIFDEPYYLGLGELILVPSSGVSTVYGDFRNISFVSNVETLTARNVVNEGIMSGIGTITTVRQDEIGGNLTNSGLLTQVGTINVAWNFTNSSSLVAQVAEIAVANNFTNSGFVERVGEIVIGNNFNNSGWIEQVDEMIIGNDFINTGLVQQIGAIHVERNFTNAVNETSNGRVHDVGELSVNRFINFAGASLTNVGLFSASRVDNDGVIDGVDRMTVGGNLTNTGGQMSRVAELTVGGDVFNRSGGGIADVADFRVSGTLNNSVNIGFNNETGTFSGILDVAHLQAGNVNNSGELGYIGTMTVINSLDNSGRIWTVGALTAGDVENTGAIFDAGTMTVGRSLVNSGVITGDVADGHVSSLTVVNPARTGSIINTGILANVREITSNTFVNQGGVLAGVHQINMIGPAGQQGVFVNQGGMIAAGDADVAFTLMGEPMLVFNKIGTLTIDGNFSSTAGTFVIGIKNLNNSVIDVLGSAIVEGGVVNVEVDMQSTNFRVGHRYRFLTAEEGLFVGQELMAGAVNDSLFRTVIRYDSDSYWLSINRAVSYAGEGKTMNQRALGRYLDQVGIYPGGDFRNVLRALDTTRATPVEPEENAALMRMNAATMNVAATSATATAGAVDDPLHIVLDQIGGSVYGTMTSASFQNTVMFHASLANVLRRDYNAINTVNSYYGMGTVPSGNLWGMIYGHAGSSSDDGNIRGYRHGFSGLMAGFDRLNERHLRLGLFLSMGQGSLSSELQDRVISHEFMLGHYFRRDTDRSYLLVQAGVGNHRYDTRRKISFIDRTARNQHNAFLATTHVEAGLRYRNTILNLSPFVGLQYTGLVREGFTEREAGSLNLTSKMEDYHSFRSMFGMRFDSQPFRVGNGLASFYGNAAWMYEFEADRRHTEFTAQFTDAGVLSGPTFTVQGNDPGRDWVQAGFGLNYDINANLRGFVGYDAHANNRQVMHAANLGFVIQR